MLNHIERESVENLIKETGCGVHLALKALTFVNEFRDEGVTMIGFVKAKTLAAATPNLTFLERVQEYSKQN